MWDACASKRGFVCGREAISIECAAGQGEGKRWNLPYGWERQREKWKGGEEEGEKGETQRPTSTHLMLPAGLRDADNTVLLIHSPSPTSSPVFCSQSLFLLPLCCSICNIPQFVFSSSSMTLWIWSHIVRSAEAYAWCQRVPVSPEKKRCVLCNVPHRVWGKG